LVAPCQRAASSIERRRSDVNHGKPGGFPTDGSAEPARA